MNLSHSNVLKLLLNFLTLILLKDQLSYYIIADPLIIINVKKFNNADNKADNSQLLLRDAMHSANCAFVRCPSVCPSVRPSVCPSHAGILSKRPNISKNCFHRRVAITF